MRDVSDLPSSDRVDSPFDDAVTDDFADQNDTSQDQTQTEKKPSGTTPRVMEVKTVKSMRERMGVWGSWFFWLLSGLICLLGILALAKMLHQAPVSQLYLTGDLNQIEQEQMLEIVRPVSQVGYFTADLAQIQNQALKLSWVDQVNVSRYWPDGIMLRVVPRHPIAQWGSGRLLSDRGDVFIEAAPQKRDHLPLLHGPVSHSQQIMQQYHQINRWFAPLGLKLRELHLTERMTWFMEFNSGLRVIVDQQQTQTKLQRLSQLAQTGLKPVWSQIEAIDLRYRNGLSIQWKTGHPPAVQHGQFLLPEPTLAQPMRP